MEVFIAILGGIFLTFTVYLIILLKLTHNKKMELLDWFLLSIATFNGLGFAFVIWGTHKERNSYIYSYLIMNFDISMILKYLILTIIFLIFVIWGWFLSKKFVKQYKSKQKDKLHFNHSEKYVHKKFISIAWVMLIISIITYWLYTRAYGGFYGLLTYSKAIRSGVFEIENQFSFFQRFGSFSFFSSYIFFGLLINKDNKKRILYGFIISSCFSLYVIYSWMGRISLLIYITTFIFAKILYSNRNNFKVIKKIVVLIFIMIFLLIFIDSFLGRSGGSIGIIDTFIKELSFPSSAFYYAVNFSEYRWFMDIIITPLYMLPMRVWNGLFNIETASSYMTYLIAGARKGEIGVFGENPVDIISFSLMQGNIIGIIVVGLICGASLNIIQNLINRIPIKGIRSVMKANIIFNICIKIVLYGDPQHIIVGNFHMICGFILIFLSFKFSLRKN